MQKKPLEPIDARNNFYALYNFRSFVYKKTENENKQLKIHMHFKNSKNDFHIKNYKEVQFFWNFPLSLF